MNYVVNEYGVRYDAEAHPNGLPEPQVPCPVCDGMADLPGACPQCGAEDPMDTASHDTGCSYLAELYEREEPV